MPQGQRKKQPAQINRKQKNKKKPSNIKKGRFDIAPKKTKHMEEARMKKTVTKVINSGLEKEIKSKASSLENKAFHVVSGDDKGQGKPSTSQAKQT